MSSELLPILSQTPVKPPAIAKTTSVVELVERTFLSYNSGRLREAARVFTERMLAPDCLVGMSLSGALTPAGLGASCLVPLVEAGFVDWIVSTGANLYHDTHFALGMTLHQARPGLDDLQLRENQIIRIYDVIFDASCLYDTDAFYRRLCRGEEFQRTMSSAEFHFLAGKYLSKRYDESGRRCDSLLVAAYRAGVPIYTSSPGDSSTGMNIAALAMEGNKLQIDPSLCVNETAALVYDIKRAGGTSGVLIWGGGSPKNFVLQTEPHIQEVLGLPEAGHDFFLQFTDARPDTGGLSGATPSEAMTWGKVDPDRLPDTVTCYLDTTVAMPLLTSYSLAKHAPRTQRRLIDRRGELVARMQADYLARGAE
ncbi:MAG TPA: deoxyhypusine synthase [Planctomycetia bacterium]|nr:deoxyhypusine synthase [Planctomycetia bacterium]